MYPCMINTTRRTRVHSTWLKKSKEAGIAYQPFSSFQKAVLDSKQGDSLFVDCKVPSIVIDVTSAWQEHCDIEYSKDLKLDMTGESDLRSYTISLCDSSGVSKETPTLNITIPEIFNIAVHADDATISMRKKIMGDISLECNTGHVFIDQLRGEEINLQCYNGISLTGLCCILCLSLKPNDILYIYVWCMRLSANLEVKKKLEGNLSVSCQSLKAQMLHGNSVDISAEKDVNIRALYSVNSSIQSADGSVHVNLSHGHSVVRTCVRGRAIQPLSLLLYNPSLLVFSVFVCLFVCVCVCVRACHAPSQIQSAFACSLSGVDGSFIVNNTNGGVDLQINKLYPGSESMAVSRHGNIATLVDPEVIGMCYF